MRDYKLIKTREDYIEDIRTSRRKSANTHARQAQHRHFMTGDEFYLDEISYWKDVKKLNDTYSH